MDILHRCHARFLGDPLSVEIRAATVDAYVLRRVADRWEVLLLERAEGTRCTGAWEVVHGRVEDGELPEAAAEREVREETGLTIERLYTISVQPFYLPHSSTITMAVVFAAVVRDGALALGSEHARFEWLAFRDAIERVAWPRSRTALAEIDMLLRHGDAGAVEDVLRVR
ncbi:MAG TPA: NUDIX domain-containing protein [Gemmatimonadaceae bacterium]|nr:NUDIX domain-containing protein [Gemmatimonadaceae bacterium]